MTASRPPAVLDGPARDLLGRLLRRGDRRRDGAAVAEKPDYARLPTGQDEARFLKALAAAEAAGAVEVRMGNHERAHLMDKVLLADLEALAAFLGVRRATAQARDLGERIRRLLPADARWLDGLAERACGRWARGDSAFGQAPSNEAGIDQRFRILAALARGEAEGVDPRTFSVRVFPTHPIDASKIVERHRTGLVRMLRSVAQADNEDAEAALSSGLAPKTDEGLGDDELLACFGLTRFPAPVFLSGPVAVRFGNTPENGLLLGTAPPFVAVQREWLDGLSWNGEGPFSILTVENLTSFHRKVREARQADVCVVYTGGFPSLTVIRALRHLLRAAPTPPRLFHWGDVDAGGARIAGHLEDSLGTAVVPHLMDVSTVRRFGRAGRAGDVTALSRRPGAVGIIARTIVETGLLLEQEAVDPVPVGNAFGSVPHQRGG